MNTASPTLMDILHFIKCLLFIIPLYISIFFEEQWRQNKVINKISFLKNNSNENSAIDNIFNVARQFFLLNMLATVIAWNIFYSFKIAIPSTTFLITFLLLSVLWGIYLLYIRMNFKYEE